MEDHIRSFLNFTHVQKLDVSIDVVACCSHVYILVDLFVFFDFQLPYIAMYRKEDIFCLLKDPETGEDVSHDKPALRWHKVIMLER